MTETVRLFRYRLGLASGGPAICPPGLYCMAGTSSVIPDPTSCLAAEIAILRL